MKAVKTNSKDLFFDCLGVFVSWKALGWEWYVIEEEGPNYYCFVQSPLCPEGEFGSTAKSDLKSVSAIMGKCIDSMPPIGWEWASV